MNAANFTPKQIAIAGISAFVLLLGTLIFLTVREMNKGEIVVATNPSSATYAINGKNKGTVGAKERTERLSPGKYTFTFTANDLEEEKREVEIKTGKNDGLYINLRAKTEAAQKQADNSDKVGQLQFGQGSRKVIANARKNDPLYSKLPIRTRNYSAYSCKSLLHPDDTTKFAACVTTSEDHKPSQYDEARKKQAIKDFKYLGIDTDKYEFYIDPNPDDRLIAETSDYRVGYRQKLSNTKPVFVATIKGSGDPKTIAETIKKDLASKGYDLKKVDLAFTNPAYTPYSTNPSIVVSE